MRAATPARNARNMTQVLAEYLGFRLAAVDGVLARLVATSRRVGGPRESPREWGLAIRNSTSGVPGLSAVSVTDARRHDPLFDHSSDQGRRLVGSAGLPEAEDRPSEPPHRRAADRDHRRRPDPRPARPAADRSPGAIHRHRHRDARPRPSQGFRRGLRFRRSRRRLGPAAHGRRPVPPDFRRRRP